MMVSEQINKQTIGLLELIILVVYRPTLEEFLGIGLLINIPHSRFGAQKSAIIRTLAL
jgi:hypothetical protein